MKQTLTTSQIADALRADQYARWSYDGAYALAEYLEQYEEDCGEELELDVVAFRCQFTEYTSALECAEEYDFDSDEDDPELLEAEALDWLQARTTVIEFSGGVVVDTEF